MCTGRRKCRDCDCGHEAARGSSDQSDIATRQRLSIPTVDSTQVTVVTDTKICDKVLAAFKPSLAAGTPLPTSLFVMKVGANNFVAVYREETQEADRVMTKQYAILSSYTK